MINQPEPLKSKIDYFGIYREQKPPKTAPNRPLTVIHEKQMFFIKIT
jgi:penicillin-binding protein-related factor A (putative recombinase)